jgi:hypothetical protein
MSGERRLKLVPYAPSDYSLGEMLTHENGYTTEEPAAVGAALSLYFQWEEHRTALILNQGLSRDHCVMDYDRDERQPSELKIRMNADFDRSRFVEFESIKIRFEVFQACYEFEAQVLAVSEAPEVDGWHLITEVPKKIGLYKLRRLPRIQLNDETRATLGHATWVPACQPPQNIELHEIGLRGLSAFITGDVSESADHGEITLGSDRFSVRVVRRSGKQIVLGTHPASHHEFGRYFDHYRKIAYPSLQPKNAFSEAEGMKLYLETQYFGKFLCQEQIEAKKGSVEATWRSVALSQHETSADYYVTENGNALVGASSASHAFSLNNTPIWAFHQLCAETRPELLDLTGNLYTWRAEYLAGRPEALSAIVWYDGKSRWLERIYTKFAAQSAGRTTLCAMRQKRCTFPTSSPDANFNSGEIKFGDTRRVWIEDGANMGAVGPRCLNASELLDAVVVLDPATHASQVLNMSSFLRANAPNESTIEVTYPEALGDDFIDGERIEGSDRLIQIPKDELVNFIYSVWHSLAVTKRKSQVA